VASRDPAGELRAQVEAQVDAIVRALAPATAAIAEWGRQVSEALAASLSRGGVRAELGDPTGDPPITRQAAEFVDWVHAVGLPRALDWPPEAGFTCPRCGRTSHHPRDLAEGYCGACHDWTGPRRG
jgi:hypothetical protein